MTTAPPGSISAFIQARMASRRFPGKVLAPLAGQPLIRHVLSTIAQVDEIRPILVLTSTHDADDPLVSYLESLGYSVFRGPEDDVFSRFQQCADRFPCDWILRVCADSPLLRPDVLRELVQIAQTDNPDLVTTRFAPTFPMGQNAELFRTRLLREVNSARLTAEDREHVTPYFYRNRASFRIAHARWPGGPRIPTAVDTVEDLRRIERLLASNLAVHETS